MSLPDGALGEAQEIAVLLIEDAVGDAAAITRALVFGEADRSFKVQRRTSLADGVAFLNHNHVDVILLDLGLPDAYHLMALTQVHNAAPHVPIVVISGHSNYDTVHQALRQGAQEFLVKGECSAVAIRQSVYQALARKHMVLSYESGLKL